MITPGKIIAVHISYESRAAERGRRPKVPSYFFKPASSVAASGDPVERPAGTELLAFEGEIALIIGTEARNVAVAEAWGHVGAVTAANDWGLYDLRGADKGSNVRNKGRDGYTPLAAETLDAARLDPQKLRLRTWKNGMLVQEDTTVGMIFPLPQLIADLSQHLTLHPGDVILTGTPAGASVARPGDTVEVEVDAPEQGLSTGRLISPVTEGAGTFNPELGSLPSVDDLQREEAWGSREAAGLPAAEALITDEIRSQLDGVAVATVSAALRKRGYVDIFIDGVHPNHEGDRILGVAKTLRFIPFRPDLFKAYGAGFNAQKRAFDTVEPGEVLVVEARGVPETGTVGDVLALRAQVRGAAGIVTDGGVRDFAAVQEFDIPVFSQGAHPSVLGRKHVPWETDVTIACGGAAVQPGDVIFGDRDGVIVIPPDLLAEVAAEAAAQEDADAWVAEQVAQGAPVDGLFPMNAQWRAKYEAERGAGQ